MAATEDLDALQIAQTALPAPGTKEKNDDRVDRQEYGDGLSQRVQSGLNTERSDWTYVLVNIDNADIQIIRTFLKAHGPAAGFLWTPPGESTPKQWTTDPGSLQVSPNKGLTSNLSATFHQEFDL